MKISTDWQKCPNPITVDVSLDKSISDLQSVIYFKVDSSLEYCEFLVAQNFPGLSSYYLLLSKRMADEGVPFQQEILATFPSLEELEKFAEYWIQF